MKVTVIPFAIGALRIIPKGLVKGDHPDYRISKIGYNTKKNPGDLSRHITLISVGSYLR